MVATEAVWCCGVWAILVVMMSLPCYAELDFVRWRLPLRKTLSRYRQLWSVVRD